MAQPGGLVRFSSILRVLREERGSGSCELPYSYSPTRTSEEEEAEHLLKYLSVWRALRHYREDEEGSDLGSCWKVLDRLKQGDSRRCSGEMDLSKGVHPILSVKDLFYDCLLGTARDQNDLSKELHLLACIEHEDLSLAHCGRPSIELSGLISELDQLVLWRTKGRMKPDPSLILRIRLPCDFTQILRTLIEALSRHFILEAQSLCGEKLRRASVDYDMLASKFFVDPLLENFSVFVDVEAKKAEGNRLRNEFLEMAKLKPPAVLRMIDCVATCDEGRVVLMDWKDCEQPLGYSAISHTFGQDVYEAFNCTCASICRETSKPRCSFAPCLHDPATSSAENSTQTRVVQDILKMCGYLCRAGVHYAWHDGVCIAQYDEDEVTETIKHIGWIYSNGKETIIFLHYVGEPRAPIWVDANEQACRWHTRVWTLQEAAFSKRRRYCIRMGRRAIGKWHIRTFADIVKNVDLWYQDEWSSVKVVEEERFYEILQSLTKVILGIVSNHDSHVNSFDKLMILNWRLSIETLVMTLHTTCFSFPTVDDALRVCGNRESKHRGDRMNSILALAGVKDFVAEKDMELEAYTLKFFEKQGQKGLARALFSTSSIDERLDYPAEEPQRHKWLPVVGKSLCSSYSEGLEKSMRLTVLGNGRLEVRPAHNAVMYCKKVRIVQKSKPPRLNLNFSNRLGTISVADIALRSLLKKKAAEGADCRRVLDMHYIATHHALCLPEASSYLVGSLFSNLLFSARPVSPSHMMTDGSTQPCTFMKDEESFNAYLVMIGMHSEKSQMLLLHGDDILGGEVSKIGVFTPVHSDLFASLVSATSEMKLGKVVLT